MKFSPVCLTGSLNEVFIHLKMWMEKNCHCWKCKAWIKVIFKFAFLYLFWFWLCEKYFYGNNKKKLYSHCFKQAFTDHRFFTHTFRVQENRSQGWKWSTREIHAVSADGAVSIFRGGPESFTQYQDASCRKTGCVLGANHDLVPKPEGARISRKTCSVPHERGSPARRKWKGRIRQEV